MAMCSSENQLPTPKDPQSPFFAESNDVVDSPLPHPSPQIFANHSTSWTPVDAMTPVSTNPSRKRSRDETAFEAESISSYFTSQQVNTPAPIPEEEPVYGEGMTLLNSRTGLSISAESQTGTWYEEKVETQLHSPAASEPEFISRMPTRKSVRLDSTVPLPRQDDIAAAVAPGSPPKTLPDQPEVDDYTLALGIGWTKIPSEDPDSQAAARGWVRYIENHYPRHIHEAQILSKSKGLNAYLVGCHEGFFLFSDDLWEGRMVARDWQTCIQNLRVHPVQYEGQDILKATNTPGPDDVPTDDLGFANMNGHGYAYDVNGHDQRAYTTHDGMELD
jgi:hypothetical protein